MDSIEAVTMSLRKFGVTGEVRRFPVPVPTAAAAAAELGCELGAIANSLIFEVAGEPLLVLASGAHRVNTAKLSATLGMGKIRRATPEFVRTATGQEIGGVAPFGHPRPIRTVVDLWLPRYDPVWSGAGDGMTMFCTSAGELERITAGELMDID